MSDFLANSAAKMRELLRGTVEILRNNSPQDYLTKYVKGKVKVETANKRGFVVVLDYKENASFGYMNPDGGTLATTHKPDYDRITCNYQYVQVGSELTNETMANSANGRPVGADAKAVAMEKAAQRMLDMEEFYFCQGDGNQTLARVTAGTTAGTTVICAGTADGFGAYFIKVGQKIRIYDSTLATLKYERTVTAKTTNGAFAVNSNVTIIAGDLILPESDATAPTTTGIKGLPYIMAASGAYFDKNKTNTPALKPIVDTNSAANSRTKLEQLNTRHRIRNGKRMDTVCVTSPTQISKYFDLFISGAVVHYVGDKRPSADLGLNDWEMTWFGQPIRDFKCLPANAWYQLTLGSLSRVSLGEGGKMITPAGDYVQKVDGDGYKNAQTRWDDAYLEYFSANPAMNSGLTNLTFSSLPLLVEDTYV
jgi:hypothetical protein